MCVYYVSMYTFINKCKIKNVHKEMSNNFLCCLPLDILGKVMDGYIDGNDIFSCVYLSKQMMSNIEKMLSVNTGFVVSHKENKLIDDAFWWFVKRNVTMQLQVERRSYCNNVTCTYLNGRLCSLDDNPSWVTESARNWHWYGILHRKNGPAFECDSGTRCWYYKGKLHRNGGLPAKEYPYGRKEWWEHGVLLKVCYDN